MKFFGVLLVIICSFPQAVYPGQTSTANTESRLLMEAADADVKTGNYDGAIKSYFKALSINKNDKELRKKLGAALTLKSAELRSTKPKYTGKLANADATGNSIPVNHKK